MRIIIIRAARPPTTAPIIIPVLSKGYGSTISGSIISYASSNIQRESSPFSIPVTIYLLLLETSTTNMFAISPIVW